MTVQRSELRASGTYAVATMIKLGRYKHTILAECGMMEAHDPYTTATVDIEGTSGDTTYEALGETERATCWSCKVDAI